MKKKKMRIKKKLLSVALITTMSGATSAFADTEYTPADARKTVGTGVEDSINNASYTSFKHDNGGAVNNAGTLTIDNSSFSENQAKGDSHQYGGAVLGIEILRNFSLFSVIKHK